MTMTAVDYGTDLSCTDSLQSGRMVSGARLVAEAAYRRLTTRPGELWYDEDYGYHIGDALGAAESPSERAQVPGLVRQELLKDQRIESAAVEVADLQSGPEVARTITVRGVTGAGPFELVLAAGEVTVELLGITT